MVLEEKLDWKGLFFVIGFCSRSPLLLWYYINSQEKLVAGFFWITYEQKLLVHHCVMLCCLLLLIVLLMDRDTGNRLAVIFHQSSISLPNFIHRDSLEFVTHWHPDPPALGNPQVCISCVEILHALSHCRHTRDSWSRVCHFQLWLLKHPSHPGDVFRWFLPQGEIACPAREHPLSGESCEPLLPIPFFLYSPKQKKCHPHCLHVKVIIDVLEPFL